MMGHKYKLSEILHFTFRGKTPSNLEFVREVTLEIKFISSE